MNHTVFTSIIDQIKNENIKKFVIEVLKSAPAELNDIPAASSGKFHPPEANEKGGLVWHIQRTCFFANMFFNSFKWTSDDPKGDVVLASLLLHDIGKKAEYKNYFQYLDHPLTATRMMKDFKHLLPEKIFTILSNCVLNHMGPFGGQWKKPIAEYKFLELLVYQCDYLASQKSLKIIKP